MNLDKDMFKETGKWIIPVSSPIFERGGTLYTCDLFTFIDMDDLKEYITKRKENSVYFYCIEHESSENRYMGCRYGDINMNYFTLRCKFVDLP